MAYVKQTWTDPTDAEETAARFNHMEDGIEAAHDKLIVLDSGELAPPGAASGTVFVYLNPEGVPLTSVETNAYESAGDEFTVNIPTATQIGDVLLLLVGARSSSSSLTGPAGGWEELFNYYSTQTNKTGAWIYRVTDQAKLDALGATVTIPVASVPDGSVRMGACLRVTNALLNSTWPTYSSGVNRSPGTLDSQTVNGFSIRSIDTTTAPFDRVYAYAMSQATEENTLGHTFSPGFTEIAHVQFTKADLSATYLFTLAGKAFSSSVPTATVSNPVAAPISENGGAQFVIPAVV